MPPSTANVVPSTEGSVDRLWFNMLQLRLDPHDGVTYSYSGLAAKFGSYFSPEQIQEYWNALAPVEDLSGAGSQRANSNRHGDMQRLKASLKQTTSSIPNFSSSQVPTSSKRRGRSAPLLGEILSTTPTALPRKKRTASQGPSGPNGLRVEKSPFIGRSLNTDTLAHLMRPRSEGPDRRLPFKVPVNVPEDYSGSPEATSIWTSRSVFVAGLPVDALSDEVAAIFAVAGQVTLCRVIPGRESRAFRGQARITFATPAQADKAIKLFNRKVLRRRLLTVQLWKEDHRGLRIPGPSIFVRGLPLDVDDKLLQAFFERPALGLVVVDAVVFKDERGQSRGSGKVEFPDEMQRQRAISAMDGNSFHDRVVEVSCYVSKDQYVPRRAQSPMNSGIQRTPRPALEEKVAQDVQSTRKSRGQSGGLRAWGENGSDEGTCHTDSTSCSTRAPAGKDSEVDLPSSRVHSVIVFGLQQDTTSEMLRSHFMSCGEVLDVTTSVDSGRQCSALVVFRTERSKLLAIDRMNLTDFRGRRICVRAHDEAYTLVEIRRPHQHHDSFAEQEGLEVPRDAEPKTLEIPQPFSSHRRELFCALSLEEWVAAVDDQWLRYLESAESATGGVRDFLPVLKAFFQSPQQIFSRYLQRGPHGTAVLSDRFFVDVGIVKLGQKRLVNKWVSANVHPPRNSL